MLMNGKVYKVDSRDHNLTHKVWQDNGKWYCSCKSFAILGYCHHITQVKDGEVK